MSLPLGEVIYIAVKPIFKIYLIIGVGIYLAKKNILTVETSKNIAMIAMHVLIPCLAFSNIVSNIHNTDIAQIGTIVIVSLFIMGGGALLCFAFGVLAGCPRNWWGGLLCCGMLPNITDLPIAYLQTMESSATIFPNLQKGVSYVMIYMTMQMIVHFNLGAYKLIEMDFEKEIIEAEIDNELSLSSAEDENPVKSNISSPNITVPETIPLCDSILGNNDGDLFSINSSGSTHSAALAQQAGGRFRNLKSSASNASSMSLAPLSKITSMPQELLENDQVNDAPESMKDIVQAYSKFDKIEKDTLSDEAIPMIVKYEMATLTFFGKLLFIPKFLSSVNYWKLCKNITGFCISSTLKTASITIILSIIICMIPWTQALFVVTPQAFITPAPDKAPPLSFLMDTASYLAAAEVPLGLLLLGATIGRLQLEKLPNGLWKVPVSIVFVRLFLSPVIGCAFNAKLSLGGLFYGDDILYFVSNVNFCLPPATSLLYITAFYTPVDDETHIQMDLLAMVYILHYICLVVCLLLVTSYTMRVSLGY